MRKILILIMIFLLLAGCSSIKTKDEYKSGVTLSSMDEVPAVTDLVELKEGIEATIILDGNRILVTTVEDKPKEVEILISFETMDIDGTQDVDLSKFYSNADKLSTASYSMNEDRTIMTITDSEKSFEVPVNVIYPKYTIASDIVIDTYLGYDVHDFVTCDTDGVEITSVLKEDDSQIIISLKKGIWDISEIKDVTLIDSNPYPIVYKSLYDYNGIKVDFPYITYTFIDESHVLGHSDYKTSNYNGDDWTMTVGDGVLIDDRDGYVHTFYIDGDYLYDYVNELNRGSQKNVPGSYCLYQRVYE